MKKGNKVDNLFYGWNPNGEDEIQEEFSFSCLLSSLYFLYLHLLVGPIGP